MLASSHLRLGSYPVIWCRQPSDHRPVKVFYDGMHEHTVIFEGNSLHRSRTPRQSLPLATDATPLCESEWVKYPFSIPKGSQALSAVFSYDLQFIAIHTPDNRVSLFECAHGTMVEQRAPKSRKAKTLTVLWLHSTYTMILVTTVGLEVYALVSTSGARQSPGENCHLKHMKSSNYDDTVHWWYLEQACVILLVNGRGVFQSYSVSPKGLSRICKFELDASSRSKHQQVSLLMLYGQVMCVFVNEKKGSLSLLVLAKDSIKPKKHYDLFAPGQFEVSVIDNVLIVHSLTTQVTFLFDVRMSGSSSVAAPLPIGLPVMTDDYHAIDRSAAAATITKQDDNADTPSWLSRIPTTPTPAAAAAAAATMSEIESMTAEVTLGDDSRRRRVTVMKKNSVIHGVDAYFYENWRFVKPHYIISSHPNEPHRGILWRLEFDFDEIMRTWQGSDTFMLVDFLVRRTHPYTKLLIFELLKRMITTEALLGTITRVFHLINRNCYDYNMRLKRAAEESPLLSETQRKSVSLGSSPAASPLVSQSSLLGIVGAAGAFQTTAAAQKELLQLVFRPCRPLIGGPSLISIVTEFIRSLGRFYLDTEDDIEAFLVDLFFEHECYYQMHQCLQFHVLRDSVNTAKRLLELEPSVYPAARQLAIDMMFRLNAFTDLIMLLLKTGHIISALRLLTPTSAMFREPGLKPADFLRASHEHGDGPQEFFAVYQFFRARNMQLRSNPNFIADDECDEYVNAWRIMFEDNSGSGSGGNDDKGD